MSGNIFVDCIFLFLICYAIINIFYSVSEFLLNRYSKFHDKSFMILELIHESESIESDLRCAISKSISRKCALITVCTDLSLEEYKLVWRLCDVYEHIILTTREELVNKLDDAKNINVSQ